MKSSVSARDAYRSVPIAMGLGGQDVAVLLRRVEDAPRSTHHAGHRVLVQMYRQAGFLLQQQIESPNQCPTAGHHDPAVDDIGRELRRRDLQRAAHRVDDLLNWLLDGFANLAGVDAHDLRNAGDEVAPLHFHLALLADRGGGPDLSLGLLLLIGERTAGQIKVQIGSAAPIGEEREMEVKGRDLVSGIPKIVRVHSSEIREAVQEPIQQIVDAVRRALEITPPELASDIVDRGIVMTGGGALIRGLDLLLQQETGLPIHLDEDPMTCVVRGAGRILDAPEKYRNVLTT